MNNLKNILIALGASLIISGCAAEASPTIDPVVKVPIQLAAMKKDIVEHTYISVGEVIPANQVDLYINGGGYIESIEISTDDFVEEDQLLVLLDDNDVDRSNYNATESQLRTVRDNIGGQLTSLTDDLAKKQVLFDEGIITGNELSQAKLQVESLQRDYDNAKNAYWNQLKVINNNLADAAKSRVYLSPISGRVASIFVKEGQGVSGQLAMTIVDDTSLYVQTFVSSDLKKQLAIGDGVRLSSGGSDPAMHIGTVHEIYGLPDSGSKLFEVWVEINADEAYGIGDYVEIEFIIERYEALMVPTQSIVRTGESQYIYVFEDNVLEKTLIEAGRTNDEWIEVKNRDNLGDVVVLGQDQLTASSEYVIIEE